MSFHPNDAARRARAVTWMLIVGFCLLLGAFFRTQVLQNSQYVLQSETNRLREVPLPAARGTIYDREPGAVPRMCRGIPSRCSPRPRIRSAPCSAG